MGERVEGYDLMSCSTMVFELLRLCHLRRESSAEGLRLRIERSGRNMLRRIL